MADEEFFVPPPVELWGDVPLEEVHSNNNNNDQQDEIQSKVEEQEQPLVLPEELHVPPSLVPVSVVETGQEYKKRRRRISAVILEHNNDPQEVVWQGANGGKYKIKIVDGVEKKVYLSSKKRRLRK